MDQDQMSVCLSRVSAEGKDRTISRPIRLKRRHFRDLISQRKQFRELEGLARMVHCQLTIIIDV